MIEGISAITLATHDMRRAVRFYRVQRFSNAAIDPSLSRVTTIGIRATTVVRQSPGLAISSSRQR
jgi:hypothetical protein